jgi:hypothetical protein
MGERSEVREPLILAADQVIEIWKTSIETQKHFAELSVKMRQIGLTVAGAILAIAVFLVRQDEEPASLTVCNFEIPILAVLFLAAAFVLIAARIIDVFVYHKMLRGAVSFNEQFERQYPEIFANIGLTLTISAYSRFKNTPKLDDQCPQFGIKEWRETGRANAGGRILAFYWIPILALLLLAALFLVLANTNG